MLLSLNILKIFKIVFINISLFDTILIKYTQTKTICEWARHLGAFTLHFVCSNRELICRQLKNGIDRHILFQKMSLEV